MTTTMQLNGTGVAPLSTDNLAVLEVVTKDLLADAFIVVVNITLPGVRRQLQQQ